MHPEQIAGRCSYHRVRGRHQPQRLPAVADLPTRLLAAAPPQALRFAGQSVARWRLAAVVAVFRQAGFQLLHAGLQHSILRQHHVQLVALVGIPFEFGNPFLWSHALCYTNSAIGAE